MAFYALLLPQDLQAKIAAVLQSWQERLPRVQWVHPDDYHLTLRFIPGLTRDRVEVLKQPLPFTRFPLDLESLQCFPPQRDRGVLWIGLRTLPSELLQLQQSLEQLAQSLGFPAERMGYTPHITIGRYTAADVPGIEAMRAAWREPDGSSFAAKEYVLMKRRSGGKEDSGLPVYEVLASFPAQGCAEASSV